MCRHCGMSFDTRQGLGGHASKKHPGQSSTYQAKVTRRSQRKNDRLVLNIAKDLLGAMSQENYQLDTLTAKLFKRQRRPRVFSAKSAQNSSKPVKNCKSQLKKTIAASKKMTEQDRGRIRRLK